MKRLPYFLFTAVLITGISTANAQIYRTSDQYIQSVKVTYGGRELTSAWAGGLNNPQFALADIDHDGKNDIVILESDKGMKTFKNIGGAGQVKYLYSPNMEYLLPNGVRRYLKILDYNGDNIPDLFHRGDFGLELCDGYYNINNLLTFQNCREIRYIHNAFSGWVNIGVGTADIPAVLDVDGDGDVDILSYSMFDNDIVSFYKNMCKEENLPASTFKIKLATNCWGREQTKYALNREHELGISCSETAAMKPSPGGQNKTTGSGPHAFTLFRVDGDNDYDMLDGYSDYPEMQMLTNGKADLNYPIDSMIKQDTMWAPNGIKVNMPQFPVAFWLDMDSDGDSDLVISPHKPRTEDKKCVAYYSNTGTSTAPSYVYQNDSLLVSDMIDLGSDSRPVIYDYDKDGKNDLLVGSVKYNTITGGKIAQFAFLKNTGSGSVLSFDLAATNLLNLNTSNFDGVAPAVGDLDNDGMDDLIIGKADGTLAFYRNHAASKSVQPVWQQWTVNLTTKFGTIIDVTSYAAPCFYDVDKDGKKDLVVGNATGYLTYYHNEGTIPGEIKLVEVTTQLGGVFVGQSVNTNDAMSAPFIGRIDNTPQDYLLVGNNIGVIAKYSGVEKGYNNNALYTRVDSNYCGIQIRGNNASPVAGNLDGDTLMCEMYIGNGNGGLFTYSQIFKQNINDVVTGELKLNIYPNPAHNMVHISIDGNAAFTTETEVSIYSNMGQKMRTDRVLTDKNIITLNTENLPQGVYLCNVIVSGKKYSSIFIKK